MEPTLVLLTAPIGAASFIGNLVVLSLALRDTFDATQRISIDKRVFHSVFTANQALAALIFGVTYGVAPFYANKTILDAVSIGAAFSIALIALDRVTCIAAQAHPVAASAERFRAGVVVCASWFVAVGVAAAPIPQVWRPIALALAQFAAPTLAMLVAQVGIVLRLRSRRSYAKTNALLTLCVLHFVVALAPPTAALAMPAPLSPLIYVPPVIAAAVSPVIYGWMSKPIRKRTRRLAAGVAKLWTKGGKITEKRRRSLKSGATAKTKTQPHIFVVALPSGTFV